MEKGIAGDFSNWVLIFPENIGDVNEKV